MNESIDLLESTRTQQSIDFYCQGDDVLNFFKKLMVHWVEFLTHDLDFIMSWLILGFKKMVKTYNFANLEFKQKRWRGDSGI